MKYPKVNRKLLVSVGKAGIGCCSHHAALHYFLQQKAGLTSNKNNSVLYTMQLLISVLVATRSSLIPLLR
jgi:hypothetical protein